MILKKPEEHKADFLLRNKIAMFIITLLIQAWYVEPFLKLENLKSLSSCPSEKEYEGAKNQILTLRPKQRESYF